MVVDGKAQAGSMKVTVESVGEQPVVVEEARSIPAMGPQRESPREIRKNTAGGTAEIVRYWLHDDVPGKVVRMMVTLPNGTTATLTATHWEKK